MYWFLIPVFILIIILCYIEYTDQDCDGIVRGEKDCCGAVKNRLPDDTQSPKEQLKKNLSLLSRANTVVTWRISMIASLIAGLLIYFYLIYTVPGVVLNWVHYLIFVMFIFVLMYGTRSWQQYHFVRPCIETASNSIKNLFEDY
jgi:hypothetical protein